MVKTVNPTAIGSTDEFWVTAGKLAITNQL
jgi:hypothetical protein